ncbi:hypothetical protein G9A89_005356 [Geosiphon pyriformis]|nr:hypothetical protein G9A89_005356 [Geosiphon pyriformis]
MSTNQVETGAFIGKTTTLTPHKISLLGLVRYYCESKRDEVDEEILFFLIDKISNEHRFPEPTLPELCEELIKEIPHEGIFIKDNLLKDLGVTLCSPHDLIDYMKGNNFLLYVLNYLIFISRSFVFSFTEAKRMIAPSNHMDASSKYLNKYSLLGIFVRRCHLEANKLSFNELGRLWQAFSEYKSSTEVPQLAPEDSLLSGIIEKYHKHKQVVIAKSDAENFALYVINQLRKYGGVLTSELENKIREIHKKLPEISTVYYIDYVNCMQSGEYEGALRSFYKFSNFCPPDEQNRTWYQHVLLNLVVLHAKFNHKQQALLAIAEAIHMARENNDQECLRFALSWLYRLKSSYSIGTIRIGASEQQMLDSLINKAKDSSSYSLQSLGELGNAQRLLQQGESPILVYESLLRSSALNLKGTRGSKSPSKGVYSQEKLLNASIYETYGLSGLSTLYASQVIHDSESNLEDAMTAYCQLADRHISFGNYEEAIKLLIDCKERFLGIRTAAALWVACMGKILHQRSVERGEWTNIELLETQLRAVCQDDEIMLADFNFHRALALSKSDREDEAVNTLHQLIEDSSRSRSPNQMLVANYLIKLAQIRIESDDPTSALPFVLSSLCLSERFNYQSSYFLAKIRLAQILLHFNLARKATNMIENLLPVVLSEHSLYLQSIAQFAYAQCMIACLSESEKENSNSSIRYTDIITPLEKALIGFRKLESTSEILVILQLQAYIYNLLEWSIHRNKAAKEYRRLITELEKNQRKQPEWGMYYYVRDIAPKLNDNEVDVDDVINAAEKIVIEESPGSANGRDIDMDIDMSLIENSFTNGDNMDIIGSRGILIGRRLELRRILPGPPLLFKRVHKSKMHSKVVVIGSGPAGHTAALYLSRATLEPVLYEGFLANGFAAGGQLTTTTDVENYPGFPESIRGSELMARFREQSIRFGTKIYTETVSKVDLSSRPFKYWTEDGDNNTADSIIIATGAAAKRLNLPGEESYWQKGISACAVCDGAVPIFHKKPLAVIGGGDSAAEEAMFLTKYGSHVYVIVRREKLRASKVMANRLLSNLKITVIWNHIPIEAKGDGNLLKLLILKNTQTGEEKELAVNGLFYAIGHVPATKLVEGQLELDEDKYIITQPDSTVTSVSGVFAAGDVKDKKYRQAITSAGSGCMAALECERWLSEHFE